MSTPSSEKKVDRKARCPICKKAVENDYRPFCSKRCADIDLGRWLGNGYAIAGSADDDEDGADSALNLDAGTPVSGTDDSSRQ